MTYCRRMHLRVVMGPVGQSGTSSDEHSTLKTNSKSTHNSALIQEEDGGAAGVMGICMTAESVAKTDITTRLFCCEELLVLKL